MEVEVRSRKDRSPGCSTGYTLVELFVCLAIAAILMTWSVPNLIHFYHDNALTAETNKLVSHLSRTRSESIKSNHPAVICRSNDGTNCTRSSEARSDWSAGWIIFVNSNDDKTRDPDEPIVLVGDAVPPEISLYFNKWWRLTFRPTGRSSNGSFTLCNQYADARIVTVYQSGRTRVSRPDPAEEREICPLS